MTSNTTHFLKKALLADASFACASGLICIFASSPLTTLMGLTEPLYLTILGIVLVLYSFDIAIVALKFTTKTIFTKIYFAADIAWIIGSAILAIGFAELFSTAGLVLIDLAAIAVAGFAYSKYVGLKKLSTSSFQHA
ncbi:hypothetical protein [Sneathiella limimaris]|uniref:hypothetical protein n=1 Tax=Sneathiella limimaris TaxID=1964213 RepID=UPI00146B9984|nr:hypothetical protein [Sneathiella limimaris]